MRTAIVIPCHNRAHYLQECFASLQNAKFPKNVTLILIDDFSTQPAAIQAIDDFTCAGVGIEKYRFQVNSGIRGCLLFGFDHAFKNGFEYVICLDSDTIVMPDFVQRILELKVKHPYQVVNGINSTNYNADGTLRNPVIREESNVVFKKYSNGQCVCLDKSLYEKYFLSTLKEKGNWDYNVSLKLQEDNLPIACTKPSVIQHIGLQSAMNHGTNMDIAHDFGYLKLPDVTLFGIDAHDPEGMIRAANISLSKTHFGAVKIITERLFFGREGYSKFCLCDMVKHITTSHVLIIHPDGYVLNYKAWDNAWLKYDYIGALWEWYPNNKNGNGGFSLRSKRLLQVLASLNLTKFHPEDDIICRELRVKLETEYGIKFAPDNVCRQFSIEAYNVKAPHNRYKGQFGFHGYAVDLTDVRTDLRPMRVAPKKIVYNVNIRRVANRVK